MVVDIYGQIVDIGYRDDIESIVLNQSENSSELVVIRKGGNHSLHKVTHTACVMRTCRYFKGDDLQDFLETYGSEALHFYSLYNAEKLGYKQRIKYLNDYGIIFYNSDGTPRLISVGGYTLIRDEDHYITHKTLPMSLVDSLKKAFDGFQVVYELDIQKIFDLEDGRYKVRVFKFNDKCGEIIEDINKPGEITITLEEDSVVYDGYLDKVALIFREEFAAAFSKEMGL
jgi:hypothetical protein